MKGIGILKGTWFESQTTGPQTNNLPLVEFGRRCFYFFQALNKQLQALGSESVTGLASPVDAGSVILVADDPADWEGFGIQNSDIELNDMDILNLGDVLCMKKISNWGYTSSFSTTSKETLKTSEPTKSQ